MIFSQGKYLAAKQELATALTGIEQKITGKRGCFIEPGSVGLTAAARQNMQERILHFDSGSGGSYGIFKNGGYHFHGSVPF